MPPPRKVDLLPTELKEWLKAALQERGFAGFVEISEELNFKLEDAGMELRIGKSAIHNYSQEYEQFAKLQDEAGAWAQEWMRDNDLNEEADRHRILFQMMTSLAFKVMKSQMQKSGEEIDPKELHFLGRMMKDIMASSGLREKLLDDERKRIAQEAKKEAVASIEANAASLGMTKDTVEAIKNKILFGAA